jgi:hypothetical protein
MLGARAGGGDEAAPPQYRPFTSSDLASATLSDSSFESYVMPHQHKFGGSSVGGEQQQLEVTPASQGQVSAHFPSPHDMMLAAQQERALAAAQRDISLANLPLAQSVDNAAGLRRNPAPGPQQQQQQQQQERERGTQISDSSNTNKDDSTVATDATASSSKAQGMWGATLQRWLQVAWLWLQVIARLLPAKIGSATWQRASSPQQESGSVGRLEKWLGKVR